MRSNSLVESLPSPLVSHSWKKFLMPLPSPARASASRREKAKNLTGWDAMGRVLSALEQSRQTRERWQVSEQPTLSG